MIFDIVSALTSPGQAGRWKVRGMAVLCYTGICLVDEGEWQLTAIHYSLRAGAGGGWLGPNLSCRCLMRVLRCLLWRSAPEL